MRVGDGLPARRVGRGHQIAAGLAPGLVIAARGEDPAILGEDRAAPHLWRDLLQIGHCPTGVGEGRGIDGGHYAKIATVTLQQSSWLTVVIICGISVILLAVGGYTGYSIVVGAVGLAAAVNLL
jgi:hypothetical protein